MTQRIKWRVKELLVAERKTQIELGEVLGINRSSTNRLVNDLPKQLDTEKLLKICQFLKCTPGDLLQLVDDED